MEIITNIACGIIILALICLLGFMLYVYVKYLLTLQGFAIIEHIIMVLVSMAISWLIMTNL